MQSEICEPKRNVRMKQHSNSRYSKQFGWIYHTPKWEFCKDLVMTTQRHCQRCGQMGEEVHHIEPLSKDISRAYDLKNLCLCCQECHTFIHRNGLKLDFDFDVDYWIKEYRTVIDKRNTVIGM